MELFNKKSITIYTLISLILAIIVFEFGYCNTIFIKQILNKEIITYNFSLCRVFIYILFIILYCIFKNKFVDEAVKTMENKYKRVIAEIVILLLIINFSTMLVFIIKLDLPYARAASIEIIASFLISLFIIYISNDFIKNAIITSCTFGILFAITTNFNHAIDEKRHFMTALNVSFFNFDYIDNPITDVEIEKLPQLSKFTVIDEFLQKKYDENLTREVNMKDIPSIPTNYNFCMYIFSGIGILIARILNGTIIDIYICGRLMNLVLYTILIIIAMKLLPIKKNIFFLIAFMPYMLLLASSYSVDGICLGTLYIFVAYCLKIYKESDTITLKQLLILLGLFIIMLIGKGSAYILVGSIVFILPLYKTLKQNKRYIPFIIIGTIIFVILAIVFLMYLKNNNVTSAGDSRGEDGINAVEQLNFLVKNPLHDLKLAITHIQETLLSFEWYANLYPTVFFTDYSNSIFFIMMLFILYVAITEDDNNFKIKDKIVLIITFILVYGMTSGILYLIFTPVGAPYISGYQTRYIFPILPLVLMCISNKNIKVVEKNNRNMNIALGTGLFLTLGIIQLILV